MIPIDMARDATGSMSARWRVLYDPDCGFCRWSLGRLLAWDRDHRLEPVALGSPTADGLLADLTSEERMRSWHLVAPDGRRWSAGAAAPPLLRLLPGGRVPAALLARAPAATERAYRWVAEHRTLVGKPISEEAKRRADARISQREPAAR
jgi:predicted DCC family thiol-disulfide oxidoreductase YuxK